MSSISLSNSKKAGLFAVALLLAVAVVGAVPLVEDSSVDAATDTVLGSEAPVADSPDSFTIAFLVLLIIGIVLAVIAVRVDKSVPVHHEAEEEPAEDEEN